MIIIFSLYFWAIKDHTGNFRTQSLTFFRCCMSQSVTVALPEKLVNGADIIYDMGTLRERSGQ